MQETKQKLFRRPLAVLLSALLIGSVSATAFAAEDNGSGSENGRDFEFSVIGSMDHWLDDTPMYDPDGDGVYTAVLEGLEADIDYSIKVRRNCDWDESWGAYEEKFDRTSNSSINVEFTPCQDGNATVCFDTVGDYQTWAVSVEYPGKDGKPVTKYFGKPSDEEQPEDQPDEPSSDDIEDYYYFDDDNILHIKPGFEDCPGADAYFSYDDRVEKVAVESGVNRIPDSLFDGCQFLTEVRLPDWLDEIKPNAFRDCVSLREIILPEDCRAIGASAFAGCTSLETAVIEVGVTNISKGAFANCSSLKELLMSSNLRRIDAGAFRGCTALEEVMIRPNVTEIITNAFAGCSKDLVIKGVPGSYAQEYAERMGFGFVALDEYDYDVGDDGTITILKYNGIASNVVIPATIDGKQVTRIGACAFTLNDYIRTVEVPEGVMEIGMITFAQCPNLETVILPDGLLYINGGAFRECPSLSSINLPDSIESLGPMAFENCRSLTDIHAPEALRDMGAQTFAGSAWMGDQPDGPVYFGNILVAFKGEAEYGYTLDIREGTIGVAAGALADSWAKNDITNVTFPAALTSVGPNSFWEMGNFKEIHIPATVTNIESGAFGCYWDQKNDRFGHYEDVVIYGTPGSAAQKYAKDNGFEFVAEGELVTEGITGDCLWVYDEENCAIIITGSGAMADYSRNNSAPWKNYEVYSIDVQDGVTHIGNDAFMGLGKGDGQLTVTLADSVRSIGNNAFNGLIGGLEINGSDKAVLPANLEEIGAYAIFTPTLSSVVVPATVTSIGRCGLGYYYDDEKDADTKVEGFTIYGSRGSAAESYADENGFEFVNTDTNKLENRSTVNAEKLSLGSRVIMTNAAEGGDGKYTFTYFYKKSTARLWTKVNDGCMTATGAFITPRACATYDIKMVVTDDTGEEAEAVTQVTIADGKSTAFSNDSTVSSTLAVPGTRIIMNGAASGSEGYRFAFYYKRATTSIWTVLGTEFGADTTAAFKARTEGDFNVKIDAIDRNGELVSKTFNVKISEDAGKGPENLSTFTAAPVSTGTRITLTGAASGGTAPYTYTYEQKKSTAGKWNVIGTENTAETSAAFTARTAGTYDMRVTVTDSTGAQSVKTFSIDIIGRT